MKVAGNRMHSGRQTMGRFLKPMVLVAVGLILGGAAMAGAIHGGSHTYTLCSGVRGPLTYSPSGDCVGGQTALRVASAEDMVALTTAVNRLAADVTNQARLIDAAMESEWFVGFGATYGPAGSPGQPSTREFDLSIGARGLKPETDVKIIWSSSQGETEFLLGQADNEGRFGTQYRSGCPGAGFRVTATSAKSDGSALTQSFTPPCYFDL